MIFAGSALIVLAFIAISITLGVMYTLISLITKFLPETMQWQTINILLMLPIIPLIAGSLHYTKPLTQYKIVQQMHIYGQRFFGYLTLNIFFKPVSRITIIFITNLNYRDPSAMYSGVMVLVVAASTLVLSDSTVIYYQNPGRYYEPYFRVDRLYPRQYENLRKKMGAGY